MARPKSLHNRAELIVDAADELFARYGYERTSIDDIAKHLRIGKGSIYLEFRTKEDILALIIKRHADQIQTLIHDKVENSGDAPLVAIKDILIESSIRVFDMVTRDIHTPGALLHTSIHMKNRFSGYFTNKRAHLLMLLEKAAALGQITPEKATDETAMALMVATSGLFPPYLDNYSASETRIDRQTLINRATCIVDLIVDGLKK
ncbi:MAG: TetR/AcrR family transcriptional regulator [Cyanobacteria bacterium REEB67]|nr:TetR/AcrR family transcriptional regulator [Cyanobacteria bacterium REEB67]